MVEGLTEGVGRRDSGAAGGFKAPRDRRIVMAARKKRPLLLGRRHGKGERNCWTGGAGVGAGFTDIRILTHWSSDTLPKNVMRFLPLDNYRSKMLKDNSDQ